MNSMIWRSANRRCARAHYDSPDMRALSHTSYENMNAIPRLEESSRMEGGSCTYLQQYDRSRQNPLFFTIYITTMSRTTMWWANPLTGMSLIHCDV
jgi:hypothetical protein